jgi:DNA repair protein RadA/Sms
MAKSKLKTVYVCAECGAKKPKWEGRCSDCGAWNSLNEERDVQPAAGRGWVRQQNASSSSSATVRLDQSPVELKLVRHSTRLSEFDRVLGGGLVEGSFVLLGGAPGIGKSTILLQMASGLAQSQMKLLYVSGEESVSQTASRAQRLGLRSSFVEVASSNSLPEILDLIDRHKPQAVVIDSIQTIYLPDLESAPGSVTQVRECASQLLQVAKRDNIAVILVGHINKEGSIAGPKVLEHMVDCVLSFEGDHSYQFRLLRSVKNRFGPAHELGVFQMSGGGLEEVLNPSELFLQERGEVLVGSSVFASMEGSRPLLCEVQALTLSTQLSNPRRTTLGIDSNRLHMLAAVLDRHLDIKLAFQDIFVNVVGGLKLMETASDLAVVASLLSSFRNRPQDRSSLFFGEVGLTGEVRGVPFADVRIKEGEKLGFKHFIIPTANKKHLKELKLSRDSQVTYIGHIQDLQKWL